MLLAVLQYLEVFWFAAVLIAVFQKVYNSISFRGLVSRKKERAGLIVFCLFGSASLLPVIAMYGLRYGIGTDYFSYEDIFGVLHKASLGRYLEYYSKGIGVYYVEPGYYVLNRILTSYRLLLWGVGGLLFGLFCVAVKQYSKDLRFAFAIYIFLSTQFIYAMNGMRFSIAVCFVLLAYVELTKDRNVRFFVCILLATLFHKSALLCVAMYFLKQYKYKGVNSVRNAVMTVLIISFPIIGKYAFLIVGKLSFFERYFSTSQYAASESMSGGLTWLLHVAPVIVPLLICARKEIFASGEMVTWLRISVMEIPFRMLGLYSTWYTRTARYSQVALVLFVPLVIAKVSNKQRRVLLYMYYVVWFTFYFGYYAIINDGGDSLPYVSVLSL